MKTSNTLLIAIKALLILIFGFALTVPAAIAATNLPFGQVTTGSITSSLQTDTYTFTANSGDVVDFTLATTNKSTLHPMLLLYNPDGTQFGAANNDGPYCDWSVVEWNQLKLQQTGKYTAFFRDCKSTNTGNYSIYAQRTNNPSGASSLTLGAVTSGTVSTVLQNNSYTFSANANDYFDFTMVGTGLYPRMRIYRPDGTLLNQSNNDGPYCDWSTVEDSVQVPTTGVYTVLFRDCSDLDTGSYNIYVQRTNNPAPPVFDLLWGEVQTGSIASTTASDTYTFQGTKGDTLDFTLLGSGLNPKFRINRPDGSLLIQSNNDGPYCDWTTVQLNNVSLPSTGTYTALFGDCKDTHTGTYTISSLCIGTCLLPAPVITSVSPSSALRGSGGFTLTVNGSNFVHVNASSVVQWNGTDLSTTWVNTGQLTAQVPASDLNVEQIDCVTVYTPPPGGGTSPCASFTAYNPAPGSAIVVAPNSATLRSADVPITVTGTSFVTDSTVVWNANTSQATSLATTYVSSTKLTAIVPASDLATAHSCVNIYVNNPGVSGGNPPGGGSSSTKCFTINNPVPATSGISPVSTPAGGVAFTLTVNGSNFVSTSTVNWNGSSRLTTFVNSGQLTASILASDIATGGTANITVTNPTPGGGTSNPPLAFLVYVPPALTTPTPISTLSGSAVTFGWTAGTGPTEYALKLGTTGAGTSDVFNGAATTALSTPVTGIPTNGVTLYAQLLYKVTGVWNTINYTYTESGIPTPPALTTPAPGSTLSGSSATFGWTAGAGPIEYALKLGTTGAGSYDVYNGVATTALSAPVTGIPTNGVSLYAQLVYKVSGVWKNINYTYTESGTPTPPALTTPTPGSTLSGSSVTFDWTAGTGPTEYALKLGTTGAGSFDVYNGVASTSLSAPVTGIPTNGVTLYAQLVYKVSGVWKTLNYTYIESGIPIPPALTTPSPGSTLSGSSVTFDWSAGAGTTEYALKLGTTGAGSSNVYNGAATTALSAPVTGIPANGVTLNAQLVYKQNGIWKTLNYTYIEPGIPTPPALTTPSPGSTLSGSSVTFDWTAGAGTTEYALKLGTTGAGSSNVYNGAATTALSVPVTGIPTNGVTLNAQLVYKQNGVWKTLNYTYIESGTPTPPALTSPAPGSTLSGSSVTFGWTAGAGPVEYALKLGTTGAGSSNVYNGTATTALSAPVTGIPTAGATLNAQLVYKVSGVWKTINYTYKEATGP